MATVTPDLAGFVDAQRRLRDGFAEPITFLQEASVTFPPGTVLDPETGKPYDPVIQATASAQASATVRCNVVFKPTSRTGAGREELQTPVGIHDVTHIMLIADITDRPTIEPCVEAIVRGSPYKIVAQKPDGIGGVQRWLIYVRQR